MLRQSYKQGVYILTAMREIQDLESLQGEDLELRFSMKALRLLTQ